jgi:hypothetical protein
MNARYATPHVLLVSQRYARVGRSSFPITNPKTAASFLSHQMLKYGLITETKNLTTLILLFIS